MATYQVRMKVTEPCFGNPDYYAEAISAKDGLRMAYAYGKTRDDAVSKVAREVNRIYYNDVEILFY